jgi:hypothetical protein
MARRRAMNTATAETDADPSLPSARIFAENREKQCYFSV